ncbi:MAG: translation initiation factor IF-2 [Desulfobulbus propionicus]|nr:MAG: translation initiation factor IF-2 [Desulfobulbus propionicus]
MSRVRVYELAREAGLKSKDLADKLIEMGYPIKGHSSTVDSDMAASIRKKISEFSAADASAGLLEIKDRSATVKRRKTVVRRRSKAQKEEAQRRLEEAEAAAAAEQQEQAELDKDNDAATTIPQEKATAQIEAGEGAEPEEQEPEQQVSEAVPEEKGKDEAVFASSEDQDAGSMKEQDDEQVNNDVQVQPARETQDDSSQAVAPPRPKKIAKVIGRVEIPTVPEQKGKPARHQVKQKSNVRVLQPEQKVAAGSPHQDKGGGKGRKKTKRVVAIGADEDIIRPKKTVKGGKKGRARLEYSEDGEVEYMRPRKGKRRKDSGRKEKPSVQPVTESKAIKRRIKVVETIAVGELAKRMGIKANEVIAALMKLGVMATVNQALDFDTASLVATDFGYEVEQAMTEELELEAFQEHEEEHGGEALPRPPVVTVMGHVDHGKTSILDAIRKTDVAEGEAGGITQHIGAYHVQAPSGDLTFVDTPGHAAFTEMRSRGAKVTDIVVLVVAADDGVMDQTKEAIAHAKAAEVPIVVAVNKIDKDNADPERVKRELGEHGLLPEEWGGDTIYCETSAKQGMGIEELLESIQLQAEILELKADPVRKAKGTVIEAQLHKGRGPVATVLVQEGTLRSGDNFVAGMYSGKVRMLLSDKGEHVNEAGPAIPVEVQGISGVPLAGDEFIVLSDEKMAKSVSEARLYKARESELASASKVSLDNLFEKMAEQEVKELRIILRADVQGTLQAFGQATEKLSTSEIKVRVLHEGTGSVTDNDIHLAAASDAIIIGFNVRPSVKVKELAEREMVDVRSYDVIYHALEDIEKAMVGMLEPRFEERVIGTADVRDTFQVPKVGTIAGCSVIEGKIERNAGVRVIRDGVVVYTGKISSLKRFKDDVKEVLTGFECGIGVENFNDIKLGDNLEAFVLDEVEATL